MLSLLYPFLLLPLALAIAINGVVGASGMLLGGLGPNPFPLHAEDHFYAQDMIITNVYTLALNGTSGEHNRGIIFDWTDPMSNTSTQCTATWLEQADEDGYPVDFTHCYKTGHSEVYMWRFSYYGHYNDGSHASVLDLFHTFKDHLTTSTPWDMPIFFARATVKLSCMVISGTKACFLPPTDKVVNGVVYAIAN